MTTYKYHYMLGSLLIESIPPIICCLPPRQTLDTNHNQSNSPPPCRRFFHAGGVTRSNISRLYWCHAMIVLRCSPCIRLQKADAAYIMTWLLYDWRRYWHTACITFSNEWTHPKHCLCCRLPYRCFAGYHIVSRCFAHYHIVCDIPHWFPPYPYHIPLFFLNGSTQ